MDYCKHDTRMHSFIPIPRFAFNLGLTPLNLIIYAKLYHRMLLSKSNEWLDEQGRVFVIYPVKRLARDIRCSERSVVSGMRELEKLDLIEKRTITAGDSNRIYVKIPFFDMDEVASESELEWLRELCNPGLPQ